MKFPILPSPDTHEYMPGFLRAPLIEKEEKTRIIELPNGKVLTVADGASMFYTTITYPEALFDREKRTLEACIYQAKATPYRAIEVYLPQYNTNRVFGDIDKCRVNAGSKGSVITVTNTKGLKGAPYLGDTFRLSNHTKVYKITSLDMGEDEWTITFFPNLYAETEEDTKIQFNNVPFTMFLLNQEEIIEDLSVDGLWELPPLYFREQPIDL